MMLPTFERIAASGVALLSILVLAACGAPEPGACITADASSSTFYCVDTQPAHMCEGSSDTLRPGQYCDEVGYENFCSSRDMKYSGSETYYEDARYLGNESCNHEVAPDQQPPLPPDETTYGDGDSEENNGGQSNTGGGDGLPASCTDEVAFQACFDSFQNPYDSLTEADAWGNCGAAAAAECACAEQDQQNYCEVVRIYWNGQGRPGRISECTPCN